MLLKIKYRSIVLFAALITVLVSLIIVTKSPIISASAKGYSTSAQSAIVIERTKGKVMYQKNADAKLPIASTTKIVTAICVIDSFSDLSQTVAVPSQAQGVEGSSIYLKSGEQLKIIDLLYGLMLQSGNDCAVALAILTSGSVSDFASLMNMRAKEMGAVNSHFCNPHGLHNPAHYSTARDMAIITAYAMQNETFRKIVGTKVYNECPCAETGGNRIIKNKNKILNIMDGGNGVKTGYTKNAGRCLVASAERDGYEIVSVVLNCGPMFEDCCDMINTAFDEIFCKGTG